MPELAQPAVLVEQVRATLHGVPAALGIVAARLQRVPATRYAEQQCDSQCRASRSPHCFWALTSFSCYRGVVLNTFVFFVFVSVWIAGLKLPGHAGHSWRDRGSRDRRKGTGPGHAAGSRHGGAGGNESPAGCSHWNVTQIGDPGACAAAKGGWTSNPRRAREGTFAGRVDCGTCPASERRRKRSASRRSRSEGIGVLDRKLVAGAAGVPWRRAARMPSVAAAHGHVACGRVCSWAFSSPCAVCCQDPAQVLCPLPCACLRHA